MSAEAILLMKAWTQPTQRDVMNVLLSGDNATITHKYSVSADMLSVAAASSG